MLCFLCRQELVALAQKELFVSWFVGGTIRELSLLLAEAFSTCPDKLEYDA